MFKNKDILLNRIQNKMLEMVHNPLEDSFLNFTLHLTINSKYGNNLHQPQTFYKLVTSGTNSKRN